jgi:hypothetical protein
MRRDERTLPLEFRGELGYRDLVAALEGLAGEHVFVGLTLGAKPMFTVTGSLRVAPEDRAVKVNIGESGRLMLEESAITETKLVTNDGNFYFRMDIRLGHANVVIADEELEGLALRD